nr:MAG TPA: Ras family [Caudoviricetes sp.]
MNNFVGIFVGSRIGKSVLLARIFVLLYSP